MSRPRRWMWSAFLAVPVVLVSAGSPTKGADEIELSRIREHVEYLASPALEGRDSPSRGLTLAARYVADQFAVYGLDYTRDSKNAYEAKRGAYRPWSGEGADSTEDEGDKPESGESRAESKGTYFRPFTRDFVSPVPAGCNLRAKDDSELVFTYGKDFVPVQGADGTAEGPLVFAGFGIRSEKDRYNDFKGIDVKGNIVMIVEGEPNHRRKFDGETVTELASLWRKLKALNDEGAEGVLVVRRGVDQDDDDWVPAFRFTYARFNGERRPDNPPRRLPPTLILSEEAATRLLDTDVAALAKKMDKSAKPARWKGKRTVRFQAKTELVSAALDNVVGVVRGSDPDLRDEFVVVGAHYDHIGAGPRGRVAPGADDNASGTAAMLEIARVLAESQPRRSVLFAAFSAEEDGLFGAKALCEDLPFDKRSIVAMVNLDMIGRGDAKQVALLGLKQNPDLEKLVDRAKRASKTGIRKIQDCRDDGLFKRSDHYPFHSILGVPVLFFIENYPIGQNRDYHTWRDTTDLVDMKKVTNTARLVHNTVMLLANDDERPPKPRF